MHHFGGFDMKIEKTHNPLQINTHQNIRSGGKTEGKPEFAKVLGASMHQQKPIDGVVNTQFIPSVANPDIRVPYDPGSLEWRAADGLLEALEAYRGMLSDPKANLNMVEPYVGRMKDLLDNYQPLLARLPDGNPVRQVLQEAMVHVSMEVERFNMGYYVDDEVESSC